ASMDAGDREGALTTRPVRFTGQHLFVNVDSAAGELRVEVLDQAGKVIAPFSRRNCLPVRANRTLEAVRWRKGGDLSSLAGQPVKFRFYLKNARLYAFWVSAGRNGASRGYVAAGGPGFTGPVDTVGEAAYAAAAKLR
ncbi:MAG: glycosyl hydrolase family 32, partial [Bryobacteraceae bacterium]